MLKVVHLVAVIWVMSLSGSELIISVIDKNVAAVEKLIDEGAELEASDKEGRTALWFAARSGDTELCRLLISHGAVVLTDKTGWIPLIASVQSGNHKCVSYLLDNCMFIRAQRALPVDQINNGLRLAYKKLASKKSKGIHKCTLAEGERLNDDLFPLVADSLTLYTLRHLKKLITVALRANPNKSVEKVLRKGIDDKAIYSYIEWWLSRYNKKCTQRMH